MFSRVLKPIDYLKGGVYIQVLTTELTNLLNAVRRGVDFSQFLCEIVGQYYLAYL